jgi:uncharacterized protein
MQFDPRLHAEVDLQPYPLLFVTISGAHLYGFPSPDSDYDLRGVHLLPVEQVIGLSAPRDTIQTSEVRDGMEIDLVTHDLRHTAQLLLKKSGNTLEAICSPLVLHTSPEHDELKAIAQRCVTRHYAHHYFGMSQTQWKLFDKERPRRVKPLLYVFRGLLTGLHLMRTGEIDANLVQLNEREKLPYIPDLIARKLAGPEQGALPDDDVSFYLAEFERLRSVLEEAYQTSHLPDNPPGKAALNDFLIRLRLSTRSA